MRRTSLRKAIVWVTWLAVLAITLQSAFPVQAQSTDPGSQTNASVLPLTDTLEIAPVSDTTSLTLTPPITLSPPITFAPLPSATLPVPPIITTSLTQVVTMPAPDVRQDDVVVQMEPPKAQGKQEAVNVKAVSGDVVHPRKQADTTPATQPLNIILDWGKLKQGQSTQVKLDLQVITPTASPIDIVLTLPAGLSYDGKSSKYAVYDAIARTLNYRNVDTRVKKLLSDSFRVDIDVPAAPALLQTVIEWRTTDGTQRNTQVFPLNIGAWHASDVLTRKSGGVFQATKQVKLTFPPNSLKVDMAVSSAEFAVVTQTIAAGDALYTANILPLEFGPDMQFDAPVTVTVDAAGLFPADLLSVTGRMPTLQYLTSEVITPALREDGSPITVTQLRVEEIPSIYDAATGLLTAQITHFSSYQVTLQQPVNPQLWKPTANTANVSLFRGALNYAYPIQTPAMVDGLQPNLNLNYSSAAADSGFDQQYQPGEWLSMGKGWSIEVPKITRSLTRGFFCDGGSSSPPPVCYGRVSYKTDYANDFTLSLGGKSYNLVSKGSGEYVPEEYAPIRARLCNDLYPCAGALSIPGSNANGTYAGNTTGEYWQVWTPDGTRWLFGIDAQTENRVWAFSYDWQSRTETPYSYPANAYGGYAGHASGTIARAGFLRRAYASARDSIANNLWSVQWLYETGSNDITSQFTNSSRSAPDDWARPIKVIYGPSIRPDGSAVTQRWLVQFEYGWGARLVNLYAGMGDANGNAWRWLRRYELGTTNGQALDGVLEYAINASGYWQSGLPRTTFGYIVLPHNNNLAPPLLNHIENGYGATWDYDYAGDPVWNSYWVTKAWTRTVVNGVVAWTGLTTYDYSPNTCLATSANAGQCVNAAHILNGAWPNNLVGFEWVNESVADPASSTKLSQTYHYFFYTNLHKLGREWQTRTFDGNGTPMSAQTSEFYDWPDATGAHGLPSGAWFVATRAVNTFPFGDITSSPYKRVVYDYDDNFNNGWAQRWLAGANLTRKVDWGFMCGGTTCDGDEVTTRYGFYPNSTTDKWIVSKLAWENIYAGADETTEWPPSGFRAQSILYYDGATSYTTPPARGQLTKVGSGNNGIAAEWVTQQIGYDASGNITATIDGRGNTTNAGYDVNGWFMTWAQTPANDAGTRLTTSYRTYGVDESGCAGGAGTFAGFGPYGVLKCVIDPNGVATASYSYDLFGRLRKLAKPGDTFAQPTEEYFYYNPNTNGTNPNNPFFVQRFVRKSSGVGINPDDGSWSNSEGYGGWWADGYWTPNLSAIGTWERTFYDGLGRAIESQTPMADWAYGGQMTANWTSYDAFGRTWQQSVPYAEAFSGTWYRNANAGVARTTTAYDALSRVTSVTEPNGALTQHFWVADTTTGAGYAPTFGLVHSTLDANGHARHQVTNGLGQLTRVREFTGTGPWTLYAETRYAYDALGNLTGVTDAAGNVTAISYDALSRKTSMSDPDMGSWAYDYDANGNLTWQRDAKGQVLTFRYDALNRMTDKYVNGARAGWYEFDDVGSGAPVRPYALGRRTAMQSFPNTTTWSRWTYDARGHITQDYEVIDGTGYATNYAYDAADRVTAMQYPNTEWVTTNYNPAGQPDAMWSNWGTINPSNGSLVQGAWYNVLGKPAHVHFPNNMRTRFRYMGVDVPNNANWGRLRQICVLPQWEGGDCYDWSFNTGGTRSTLMNIGYWYDAAGNVTYFDEYDKGYSTAFGYDALDRLKTASGATNESYDYDTIGNLTYKAGVTQYYWDASHKHAVTNLSLNGTAQMAWYDANGNMTQRKENGTTYTQVWNADNLLTRVTASVGGRNADTQFFYDADGNRVKKVETVSDRPYIVDGFENTNGILWAQGSGLSFSYNDSGNPVLRTAGTGYDFNAHIDRAGGDIASGRSVQVDFKVANADTGMHLTLQTSTGDYWRWSLNHIGNDLYNCYANPSGWAACYPFLSNLQLNTWYRARLTIDDANGAKVEVWLRDSGSGYVTRTQAMPTGRMWFFFHTVYSGVDYLDNYSQSFTGGAQTTVYVGNHFEKNVTTGEATSYYTFNGQRIALRSNAGVLWLHGDMLGSASLLTDGGGSTVGQARYKPFGERRSEWNAYFTDRKFTGYAREDALGGIDYAQARFYDPLIGRFLSPDTIYDGSLTDPQGLNRYSYVRGHVMNSTDPTGHCMIPEMGGTEAGDCPGEGETYLSGGRTGGYGDVGSGVGAGPVAPSGPNGSDLAKAVIKSLVGELLTKVIESATGKSSGDLVNPYADYGVSGTDAGDWKQCVPGKFQEQTAGAFDGPITAIRLDKPADLYRHWGDKSQEAGRWYSPDAYAPSDARVKLALPDGNSATNVSVMRIDAGEVVLIGKVKSQAGDPYFAPDAFGGGKQVLHNNWEKDTFVKRVR